MGRWGGYRENSGRPTEFNERVSRVFYIDEEELAEVQKWIDFLNSANDDKITLSNLVRRILVEWTEDQRKEFPAFAARINSSSAPDDVGVD